MSPDPHEPTLDNSHTDAETAVADLIRRLVRGAAELEAIESGQVDAIIDPATGGAILLPKAKEALGREQARYRRLVGLAADGYWEQDEHYRFVLHAGTSIGSAGTVDDAGVLGRTLWDLSFADMSADDWQTHRRQLESRAAFRDLELTCVDRAGKRRRISLDGDPVFDAQGQFKGYRGTTRNIGNRPRAEAAVPESDPLARATLDALAARVCVLDAAGTVSMANTAWRAFAAAHSGLAAGVPEGGNYLAACDTSSGDERVDGIAMADGIRQVIAGEREIFRYEYSCDTPTGPLGFLATVKRLHTDGAARAVVSCEDITELKRAERLQGLEYTVARCLADADSISAALQGVIRAVCDTQSWDCGQYFRLDPAAGVLCLMESWCAPVAAVEQVMERSLGVVFRPGAGLAGRVYRSGQPLWILNGSKDARASHMALAHEVGLEASFFFPVIADDMTIGVLAFASRTAHEPDDRLLLAVRRIGTQLGQFLQRRRAEDALRQSEEHYRRLTELSSDWVWQQDREFRFTQVARNGALGGQVFGKTLWELPTIVPKDADWTEHKLQVAAHWSFYDFEYTAVLDNGQLGYYSISGEPVYDDSGVFCGYRGTGLDITERRCAEIRDIR